MISTVAPGAARNRLLHALPASLRAQLAPNLVTVNLQVHQVLEEPDEPIRFVYFPLDVVVSLVVTMEHGHAVEGATIGNEGLIGLELFLGNGTAISEMVVQIPGATARLSAAVFREAINQSTALQVLLQRYTVALMNQMARTAACNGAHAVQERCARWLLMCLDRVGAPTFPLTHESLASLLGVRRASVSEIAETLQREGLIEYRRGSMTILDPDRLEAAACEDYRLCSDAYDRMYD